MRWLPRFVTAHPRSVIVFVALVTAALATELRGLRPEVDLRDLIPTNHPYVEVDQDINARFGVGLTAVLAIGTTSTVFQTPVLSKIDRITSRLAETPGVIPSSVMSLASENTRTISREGDGIYVGPLMRGVPETQAGVDQLMQAALESPLISRYLVTKDLSGAMIIADFDLASDAEALSSRLEEIAAEETDSTTRILVGGQPSALAALDGATREIVPLLCLSLALVALVHLEAFRTLQGALLPLLTAVVSVVWSIGLARLLGFRVTPWTALTTILVLSVSAGHAVQMLKRYYECLAESGQSKRAVVESMDRLGPVMITAGIVAAAGFASLAGFGVPAVKDFGVIAGCGIVSALIVELTLIPAIRTLMIRDATALRARERRPVLQHLVSAISTVVIARPRTVVAGVVFAVVAAGLGISLLKVDTAFRSWFDSSNKAIVADREIRGSFIGTSSIRVLIESEAPRGVGTPEAIAGIKRIQEVIEADSNISTSLSVADFVRATHAALDPEGARASDIPEDPELLSQYLLVLDSDSLSRLITTDRTSAVIYAFSRTDSVEWAKALLSRIESESKQLLPGSVRLRLAGGELAQAIANNDTVVFEKLKNMLQVAAVIFVLSSVVFRSVTGGLLVLAPLACAAAVNLGVMGWVGSRLSFATATYTSMGVSLGADFAIYLLFRIREELFRGDVERAVAESLRTAGEAIVFVASAIAAGYAALIFSSFALWRELGAYVGLMMLVSALCTATLLPALVLVLRPGFLTSKEPVVPDRRHESRLPSS